MHGHLRRGFLQLTPWSSDASGTASQIGRSSKDDSPFAFAGLWEGWKDPSTSEWLPCTIITGEPNELPAQVHTRMPVILADEHHAKWLGETQDGDLKELLKPFRAQRMKMWPISPRVNDPKSDDEGVLKPI
jgi:putative SOS response-associated peptidase YedK